MQEVRLRLFYAHASPILLYDRTFERNLWLAFLFTSDHVLTSRAGADPFHRDTAQAAFDVLDVGAGVRGEILVLLGAHGVALPAGQGDVLHLDLVEDVGVGGDGVLRAGAVGQDVGDTDLDLIEVVQDIQLRQIQSGVVVDRMGVAADDQVEPTAATTAAGGDTEFTSDLLQFRADLVELFTREGTGANASGVGFHYTDDRRDAGGVQGKGLDGTTQTGRRGSHVGVSAVVQVEHESVRTLDQGVGGVLVFLQEGQLVDDVRSKEFAVFLGCVNIAGQAAGPTLKVERRVVSP